VITVAPYAAGDKESLYGLLSDVWPGEIRESHDRRWWWREDNPPLALAWDEQGSCVGMCGGIPFVVRARGEERRGAWIVDFFVRSDQRGRGVGGMLVRHFEPQFDFLASLNQTDAAYSAFRRAGWRGRSWSSFFLLPSPGLHRALSLLGGGPSGNVDVSRADGPPGMEYDALWKELRDSFDAASMRDRGALDALTSRAGREYVLLRASRNGVLRGYFVLRELGPGSIRSFPRFPILLVSDHLAPGNDSAVFGALMAEAARLASARGLHFILCMTTQRAQQQVLTRRGFLSSGTPLLGRKLRKLDVGFTATPTAPAGNWYLTPADCDLDILFGAGA
jgi:GNAT superfamily N-acetyltransferase